MESSSETRSVLKYRNNDGIFQRWGIYTGQVVGPRRSRTRTQTSILHRLPTELLFEIMDLLSPDDLYFFRQSSAIFLHAFSHRTFARYHSKDSPAEPESKDVGKSLISRLMTVLMACLLFLRLADSKKQEASIKGQIQQKRQMLMRFDVRQLSYSDRQDFRKRVQRGVLCKDCALRAPRRRYKGLICIDALFCLYCRTKHLRSWFSDGMSTPETQLCIPREGKLIICPHYQQSFKKMYRDKLTTRLDSDDYYIQLFECQLCAPVFKLGGGMAPGIYMTRGTWVHGIIKYYQQPLLIARWKLPICKIGRGEVLTKERLQQSLRGLQPLSHFLCPHVAFDDTFLMRAFEQGYCICFQNPSDRGNIWHWHSPEVLELCRCCACRNRSNPDLMGRFMAGGNACRHLVRCPRCPTVYEWILDGRQILLEKEQSSLYLSLYSNSEGIFRVRPKFGQLSLERWIRCLDPVTFRGNEASRFQLFCIREGCSNAVPEILRWDRLVWESLTPPIIGDNWVY